MTDFSAVKMILDSSISAWMEANGEEPDLILHGASFGWETRDELLNGTALTFRMVEPDKVGNGRGKETYLIQALRGEMGNFAQMPSGGPFLSEDEIEQIVHWIDAGCP